MLPPGGILEAPRHVGTAPLRSAGSAGIKVTYRQTMHVVELVVHLSQILVEVIGGGNIALPSCVASAEGNVGQGNVGVDDLRGHRLDAIGAIPAGEVVADVGLNAEFLDGIRVGQNVTGVAQVGHVYAAVQIIVH